MYLQSGLILNIFGQNLNSEVNHSKQFWEARKKTACVFKGTQVNIYIYDACVCSASFGTVGYVGEWLSKIVGKYQGGLLSFSEYKFFCKHLLSSTKSQDSFVFWKNSGR